MYLDINYIPCLKGNYEENTITFRLILDNAIRLITMKQTSHLIAIRKLFSESLAYNNHVLHSEVLYTCSPLINGF